MQKIKPTICPLCKKAILTENNISIIGSFNICKKCEQEFLQKILMKDKQCIELNHLIDQLRAQTFTIFVQYWDRAAELFKQELEK